VDGAAAASPAAAAVAAASKYDRRCGGLCALFFPAEDQEENGDTRVATPCSCASCRTGRLCMVRVSCSCFARAHAGARTHGRIAWPPPLRSSFCSMRKVARRMCMQQKHVPRTSIVGVKHNCVLSLATRHSVLLPLFTRPLSTRVGSRRSSPCTFHSLTLHPRPGRDPLFRDYKLWRTRVLLVSQAVSQSTVSEG
jgi:hypothetical protein